jgi:hypothetical protein
VILAMDVVVRCGAGAGKRDRSFCESFELPSPLRWLEIYLEAHSGALDIATEAYWLIALVIAVIVLEEILRKLGVGFKKKPRRTGATV